MMDSKYMQAADKVGELIVLKQQTIVTLEKLQRAYLLLDLLGVPLSEAKYPIGVSCHEGNTYSSYPWRGAVLSVRLGDQPRREFPLMDVDQRLWPAKILARYKRHMKAKEKRREYNGLN